MPDRPLIFISYSPLDELQKNQLVAHLGVLEQAALIEVWSEERIKPGTDWQREVKQAIDSASLALLLITPDYLNSSFITLETIPALLERQRLEGLALLPIIARACAWDKISWLEKMEVRPRHGQPIWRGREPNIDEELAAIVREIATLINFGRQEPMNEANFNLIISLDAGERVPQAKLYQMTGQIQQQLNKSGAPARRAQLGELPPGAKGPLMDMNTLVVAVGSTVVLWQIVQLLRDWLLRDSSRTIEIKAVINGTQFEYRWASASTSSQEVNALIKKLEQYLKEPRDEAPVKHQLVGSPITYDFKNIRMVLMEGFTDEELRRFCYDSPGFRPVYDQLAQNTDKAKIVDRLIEYADRRSQMESLLNWVREQNPARYAQHGPYSRGPLLPDGVYMPA